MGTVTRNQLVYSSTTPTHAAAPAGDTDPLTPMQGLACWRELTAFVDGGGTVTDKVLEDIEAKHGA